MKNKRILSLLLAGTLLITSTGLLAGCTDKEDTETTQTTATLATTSAEDESASPATADEVRYPEAQAVKKDTVNKVGYQLDMPKKGDEIAIIHTTLGDISLRLFPENAPKAVENFVSLAKEGKYNNIIFHKVESNFLIQTGDIENNDGTGGQSIWGGTFEDEFCDTLFNIRGAVSMANQNQPDTNGSQFFINQTDNKDEFTRDYYDYDYACQNLLDYYEQFCELYGEDFMDAFPTFELFIDTYTDGISPLSYAVPEEVWKLYEEQGGNIHLDACLREKGGKTVFAQVFDGMDVVDEIANVEVDDELKPKTDIKIISVEITKY